MDHGTAHITTIEDPVDCSFLDRYSDWRKHLREPTERERWRDELIRRLLKPYLEPHAPLDFLPNSLDTSGEKERTEVEDILEPALDRAEDCLSNLPDPMRWLSKLSDDQDPNPFNCDPVDDQDRTVDPEIVFQRLIREAREHQMQGEAYLAVVKYSRALYTVGANAHRSIILEAQDATQSAGLLDSVILESETFPEESEDAEWTDEGSDDSTQEFLVRPLTSLICARQSLRDWAGEYWEEDRLARLDLLRRIMARLHKTTFADPDKFYWMFCIACTCQYFLLSTLKSPFGIDAPADDKGHEFITRVLFYLWHVVGSEIEGTSDDTAALAFLRFRIAKSLSEIQPYLDSGMQKQLGMPANLRETDAVHGLGLSAEILHSTPSLISPLRSILIAFHDKTVVLTCGLCRQIVACLDNLVQLKAALSVWGLLLTFRLVGLGSGMGIGKRLHYLFAKQESDGEALVTQEALSLFPLFRYNIAAYYTSYTPSTASSVLSPPSRLARLAFPFSVPRPVEEEQERLAIAGLKAVFFQRWRVNVWYPPAWLGQLFAPYISSFGWEQYEARMTYVATCVKQHSEIIIDDADPWRLIGRAIGLGRLDLSKDYTARISELQVQIDTMGQLTVDVEHLISGYDDPSDHRGSLRAQLHLLLGEAYLELSESSKSPDKAVRLALKIFEECEKLAVRFHHEEVKAASLRRLVDVQAKMWQLGRAGVRPEDIHLICLEAEVLLRPRLNFSIETSATSPEGRNRSWRAPVAHQRLLLTPRAIATLAGHIFAVASEVSLSQGKPVDALCWIQRGKANVTAGLITQQRSLIGFMSYLAGDRRRRPRSEKELAKMWWQFVHSEEARSYVAFAQQHPTITKSHSDFKRELKQLRDTFETRSSLLTGPGERTRGRVVLADWSLASGTDAYCLCVASIPGTPQFFSVSIKPSEVRRWRDEHWDQTDKSLEMPERESPLRTLDELISPLAGYLQTGDTVILCPTGDLHCLPIHALHLRNELPLIYFHPVVHAPNLKVYLHCIQNCRHLVQKARGAVPAMAAVYPSLSAQGPSPRHARLQQSLYSAVHEIAASLGADLYWDDAVTRQSLLHALRSRGVLFFIGHCISDSHAYMSVQHRLLLSNHELFSTTDFLDNNITPSLLVLLGCGTAQHTVPVGDEMMNLISGALVSGATSVLGTLWPIRVETAVMFARSLSGSLKAKEHVVDGQLIDVARAMQRAILELRESHSKPVDWAGATTAKNVRTDLTDSPPLLPHANVTTAVSIAEGDDPNDFADEAILRSYAARTIPYFEGTEDDEDDGEDSDTEEGASNLLGLGMRNMFGRQHQTSQDEIFGARGISGTGRAQELLNVPSSDDHRLRIEITWAEKGTYNKLDAHFIRLTVENIGPNKDPLKSLALAVRVRPAPHAKRSVQSAPDILVNNAAASSTAIPDTASEDSSLGIQAPANSGTRSLDGATAAVPVTATGDTALAVGESLYIAHFAPKTYSGAPIEVDHSSDLEVKAHAGGEGAGAKGGVSAKKSWGADWTVDERYRLQIYLDRPEVYSFTSRPAAKDDSKTIMRVYYDSNKMYKHSTPTLHLGLVVVSYGAPFILTARAGVTPNRANPLKARVTRHSPIKFAKDGPELIPPGYERIGIDFVSKEMAEKMKRLVPLPKESEETVHLGSDTVVLE